MNGSLYVRVLNEFVELTEEYGGLVDGLRETLGYSVSALNDRDDLTAAEEGFVEYAEGMLAELHAHWPGETAKMADLKEQVAQLAEMVT